MEYTWWWWWGDVLRVQKQTLIVKSTIEMSRMHKKPNSVHRMRNVGEFTRVNGQDGGKNDQKNFPATPAKIKIMQRSLCTTRGIATALELLSRWIGVANNNSNNTKLI